MEENTEYDIGKRDYKNGQVNLRNNQLELLERKMYN